MTAKKATDLDDIAIAISDLTTFMGDQFEQVNKRFSYTEEEIAGIHKESREMREWMIRIDNRLTGIENDIKKIYDRILMLENKKTSLSQNDKQELERPMAALFDWARQVSKQTGISLPKL